MTATLPIIHHPAYVASLPDGHRFPMAKFGRLRDVLVEEGLVAADGFWVPEPVPEAWLCLAHSSAYVDAVIGGTLSRDEIRRIGLPVSESVARRSRLATGGTILAARLALTHGLACNTAGGSHHAAHGHGAGFSVFNDVAVAASVLLDEGRVGRVLVVDLDVHQGDGTAAIFENDARVFTFSMHGAKNFPVRKQKSDLDLDLPDGMGDTDYLSVLADHLPDLLSHVHPDLVFYNAGVDPHAEDQLGRLSLSDEGLARRDRLVIETTRARDVPLVGVIGGGYSMDIDALARRHAILHRTASTLLESARSM